MRLQELTGLERDKIKEEHAELMKTISHLKSIFGKRKHANRHYQEELMRLKKNLVMKEGRSEYAGGDFRIEDMIPDEEVAQLSLI